MKVSRQAQREAKQLFRSCQVKGRMDADRVRQAVRLLVEKKPRGYVGILHHIQRLVKLDEDSRTARVESAVALDGAQQQSVRESLERMKSGEVRVEFAKNADLIGGMRVKIGDDVFDGSVRTRLAGLRDSF
ncbi:MAG: H(+)-transporting ATPase [Verrucomicrobiales bacterium]|nr:H(+)-transporting ATPase [Verrucomicrobiales bacterium]